MLSLALHKSRGGHNSPPWLRRGAAKRRGGSFKKINFLTNTTSALRAHSSSAEEESWWFRDHFMCKAAFIDKTADLNTLSDQLSDHLILFKHLSEHAKHDNTLASQGLNLAYGSFL
jgi:hypothetical protein